MSGASEKRKRGPQRMDEEKGLSEVCATRPCHASEFMLHAWKGPTTTATTSKILDRGFLLDVRAHRRIVISTAISSIPDNQLSCRKSGVRRTL